MGEGYCGDRLGEDGEVKTGERVDEKGQKEKLGGRTMDCSTGVGGIVKRMRIRIENSDDRVNNTGIKKRERKKKKHN
jgi:hypothetical protein